MKPALCRSLATWMAGAVLTTAGIAAEAVRPNSSAAPRSAAGRPATPARGLLPDPVLLDGSTHAAEKKSEIGMIGDFELPGDDNGRSGKVGGGGGGQPEQQNGSGALPPGLAGGGQQQGGKSGAGQEAAKTAQAGGGGPEGKESDQSGGGAGDPNAKAEGIKVAELAGDPSGSTAGAAGQKPGPVAIGDKAMRIPQQTPNQQVVGAQQAANQNTQVYEKGTGTGGKGPTGTQGPNRTEKGRAIPAGL